MDDKGASIGWNISKRIFRAMIDSALGLDPEDMSDAAKAKRQPRGLADLNGITFVAKVAVEPNKDPRYPDHNRLDHPVPSNEKEWLAVMNGETVPPRPSKPRATSGAASAQAPAWSGAQQKAAAAPATAGTPLWRRPADISAPAPQPTTPSAAPPEKPAGPAWLNG